MGTSASGVVKTHARTIIAALAAFMLCLGLAPATSFAADAPMLASSLLDGSTAIVSEDVELVAVDDGDIDAAIEPVIGSFTVDGLTFAVGADGVTLVSVDPSVILSDDAERSVASAEGAGVKGSLSIPSTITYAGVTYPVTAIGPYAFYLSGATEVQLPASVVSADDKAFRSSAVGFVSVDADNPNLASFDGCLYDSRLLSLLLIPEGRAGVVLLPSETEVVEPSKFSHCSLVEAIDVEEGDAAVSSWEGLLYDASGTTLLRVPAGVTEITIREGCTTIAAGAMEGCAKLERINAPATVASISPDVFQAVPTVSLPSDVILSDDAERGGASPVRGSEAGEFPDQISAIVALDASMNLMPQVDPSSIKVALPDGAPSAPWLQVGVAVEGDAPNSIAALMLSEDVQLSDDDLGPADGLPMAALQSGTSYAAGTTCVDANGGYVWRYNTVYADWDITAEDGSVTTTLWRDFYVDGAYLRGTDGLGHLLWYGYWEGIRCSGWSRVANNGKGGTRLSNGYRLTANEGTIYACWPSVTVTFNKNNTDSSSTQGTASISCTVAQAMPAITLPSRPGYTFAGYWDAASGGTRYYNDDGSSARKWDQDTAKTLYAHWTKNAIQTVNIYQNAGDTTTKYKTVYLWYGKGWYDVSNPTDTTTALTTIGTPTRAGYTYAGTNTTSSATTNQYKMDSSTTFPGNTYYGTASSAGTYSRYVVWTKNKVSTVNLYKNAGDTTTKYKTVYLWYGKGWYETSSPADSTTALTTIGTPTWAGRTYKGFATSSTATSGSYWTTVTSFPSNTSSTFGSALTAKTTNLYAVWSGNKVTLTWDAHNEEEATTTEQTHSTTETSKVSLPTAPTWAGRTFAGWYTAATGGTQVTNATDLPAEDTTYHAHWTEDAFTITYDYDGGSVTGNPTTYKVSTTTFTLKNPTKTGYTFTGWSGTDLEGDDNASVKVEKGSTGDRSYVAHWKANSYQVEYYDITGSTLLVSQDWTYDEGQTLAGLPAEAVTPGYKGVGWANSSNQSSAAYSFGSTQKNLATGAAGDTVKKLYLAESPKQIALTWSSLGEDFATTSATYSPTAKVPMPAASPTNEPGWALVGWWTEPEGGTQVTAATSLPAESTTYYAHWAPVVSAVVPLEATARVDLLGLEDQQAVLGADGYQGYVESRCALPLDVVQVDYAVLPGAAELFGSDASQVLLEAFVGTSDTPNLSFVVDVDAVEEDPVVLSAFAMGSYGDRVGVTYLFVIPEAVLAAIDQARFSEVTTPVGQLMYTVALAS